VFAHPDDESLFFAPALRCLSADGAWQVQWLCLSTGERRSRARSRLIDSRASAR
jgi:LmbE family N-acetylglucosaminyl deacetylase